MVYSYNKSQQDALFLNFILERTLHVSDSLNVHHQESEYCIHSNWYLSYSYVQTVNITVCQIPFAVNTVFRLLMMDSKHVRNL